MKLSLPHTDEVPFFDYQTEKPGGCTMQTGNPATRRPVRVLIMDAQEPVRQALSAIINRQPDMKVVAQSGTQSELMETFKNSSPDVALLDLETSGCSEIRALLEHNPGARIIALSLYEDQQAARHALQAGALMWLLKGAGKMEILEAIRTCMKSAPLTLEQRQVNHS